jgi:hypothetical protein
MRDRLTRQSLGVLMRELARCARGDAPSSVYLVGGATAVLLGWRESSIDADLDATSDAIFRDVQAIKDRLRLNIERARPEDFVPALAGSAERHVFIQTLGSVSFFHYDPYAQLLSKIARGFDRDLADARQLIASGMVEPERFRALVHGIADSEWAKYPRYSPVAVRQAVKDFLAGLPRR